MKADLHIHSTCSGDSDASPERIFQLADQADLGAISITDHNCVDGIAEARELADRSGIAFIPGLEVDAEYEGKVAHVLAYSDDIDRPAVRDYLENEIFAAQREYVVRLADTLGQQGLPPLWETYDAEVAQHGWQGWSLVRSLFRQGVIRSAREYLQKIVPLFPPGMLQHAWSRPLPEVVAALKGFDATVILAHPRPPAGSGFLQLTDDNLTSLAETGIDGIEVHHRCHDASAIEQLRSYARKYNWLITGGSDYHGREPRQIGTPHIQIEQRPLPGGTREFLEQTGIDQSDPM